MRKEVIGKATLYLGDCLEVLTGLYGLGDGCQNPDVSVEQGRGAGNDLKTRIFPFDAVITDPPYNVGKDYGTHDDAMSAEDYEQWCRVRVAACRAVAPNQFWVAPRYKLPFWFSLLPEAHLVVVPRGAAGPFRAGWMDQFEIALAVGRPSRPTKDLWTGIRLKGEGYFFREDSYGHPGYTPLPIMERAVDVLSAESVCDPFLGTGTTGEAAMRAGRRFVGIEIHEPYFDIACTRIENVQRQGKMFA